MKYNRLLQDAQLRADCEKMMNKQYLAPAGSIENQVATLETRAVAKMSEMTLSNSFHDYANIVRRVERATLAVNKAFHALHLAHLDFDRQDDQQNLY